MQRALTLRAATAVAAAVVLAATATACGSSGPGSGGGSGKVTVWSLQDTALNPVQKKSAGTYNAASKDSQATLQFFVNDPYKQKLQTALGSPNAPDVFLNWGGGNLSTYVKSGNVADLSADLDPAFRSRFLPSVLAGGTVDGKVYGVPMEGVQPVALFYNKDVFTKAGISTPPATWQDLLHDIDLMKAEGVTPIALAGSQAWTELMWMEYLLDRVGGPGVFAGIQAGKPGAWQDPAVATALGMIRDLVDRGAFGSNYGSVGQDSGGADALLSKGRAGMELMGSWEYAGQLATAPDFVKAGKLGWTTFPTVANGKGDPKDVVGNPSNFFSVTAKSAHRSDAADFIKKTVAEPSYVKDLIDIGQVPAIAGIEGQLRSAPNADYTTFVYQLVQNAPSFTQSWDQALDPATAQTMLTNLQKVFNKQSTPQQFVSAMDAK
ncbi:extracellular solute-binding protein [Actinacidiphila rubida]|uniref:Carbohydrate ABC transporter substrate-binding protein, CUT1 family n=1 Tax=Actinacidiphila rubida TaxID=310780 RepID=A0A1H8FUR8_9ACTN|nr:extracellular solute-binding protein [Actinacidiphila rubida]SEN35561.1 carbohydrate ABC transporter substrate-binding protein, CUT1 family [Actinacidiphila rubida]